MKKFNGYANTLAFFLAAFLAFGLFVGCKESEPEPEPPKEYMITYILDDSIANEDSFKNIVLPKNGKVEENTVVTLESLTVTGWTFDGWFVDNQKVNTTDYKIVKDTNFVAKFTKIPTSSDNNNDNNDSDDGDSSDDNDSNQNDNEIITPSDGLFMFEEEMNPEYSSRTEALDTIFNPDELGEIVLVIDRSEWNKHLDYCDYNLQHEDSVKAKGFYFKKDNKQWFFKDIGFRIRGNTSRLRPQEKKSDGTNGKYVQAHFALDFEEWTAKGVDKKLADSMKGLILKRANNDSTYVREIYGYNLFRKNGIWIAPRAAFTTLKIQIVDDLDLDKDGNKTEFETVNYGVYGMVEEIKKQFLKERTESGTLQSNKGNLWKCTWQKENGANFVYSDASSTNVIGEEDVYFDFDKNGKITNFTREVYNYDYKGDKKFADGKTQLLNFMKELNELPDCTDGKNDASDIETIKSFYTNKMDGDLFLRTYAINVILGMWDDYWINKNNFYFYFDSDEKAYFIPYDYDNILGTNGCNTDAGMKNPLNWGSLTDGEHPLIQKILQVPEYMEVYKKYLLEYSNENSYFDDDKSITQITNWHNMFKDYIASKDLAYYSNLEDKPASWGEPYVPYTVYTPGKMNYFTVRQNVIQSCVNPSKEKLTLTLNAGNGKFSSGKNTYNYNFTQGRTLKEVLEANGFSSWSLSNCTVNENNFYYAYENKGVYYYPCGFIDSEGNKIYEDNFDQITLYENTSYNTLYKKYIPVTFDFNDVLEGSRVFYFLEESNIAEVVIPEPDDYICIGWTETPNGNDFVTKVPSEPVTFYAKWMSKDDLLPFKISEDFSKVTFTFRPNDYNNYGGCLTDIQSVHLMAEFTGNWEFHDMNKLKKDSDGNYSIILNSNDVYNKWPAFKFMVNEKDWFGAGDFKYSLPSKYSIGEHYDFNLVLPESTITFNLNGGTTTSYLEDSYGNYAGWELWYLYQYELKLENPTKDGFAFGGWTLTKDGDDFVDRIPFGKITVYAKWEKIGNPGCSGDDSDCSGDDSGINEPGCSEDNSGNVPGDATTYLTLDTNGHPVTFCDMNHDFSSRVELEFTPGQTIMQVLEDCEVDWSTQYEQDGKRYQFTHFVDDNENCYDFETVLNESITLYLVFEPMPPCVTFDLNGGYICLPVDGEEVRFDNSFSRETWDFTYGRIPQRDDGFVFRGWTLTLDGDDYVTTAESDITVYAKWDKLPTVTFNLNGGYIIEDEDSKNFGPIEISVDFGVTFERFIPDPLKDKYSFIGWTLTQDGEDYVTTAESDTTVYAKWRDSLELFSEGDIVGDFNGAGTKLDYQGEGLYYYDFTYQEIMNAWGNSGGKVAFKFRPVAGSWDVSYGPIEGDGILTIGGEEIEFGIASGTGTDLIIEGLQINASYRIKVRCTEENKYYVSVILISPAPTE